VLASITIESTDRREKETQDSDIHGTAGRYGPDAIARSPDRPIAVSRKALEIAIPLRRYRQLRIARIVQLRVSSLSLSLSLSLVGGKFGSRSSGQKVGLETRFLLKKSETNILAGHRRQIAQYHNGGTSGGQHLFGLRTEIVRIGRCQRTVGTLVAAYVTARCGIRNGQGRCSAVQFRSGATQEHLLEQGIDVRHAKQSDELDLLDHLPGDGLQGGQGQQDLAETSSAVVLTIADVIFEIYLDLIAQLLDLCRFAYVRTYVRT